LTDRRESERRLLFLFTLIILDAGEGGRRSGLSIECKEGEKERRVVITFLIYIIPREEGRRKGDGRELVSRRKKKGTHSSFP